MKRSIAASVAFRLDTCLLALALLAGRQGIAADPEAIDYDRDIRPILSAKCFACHGPDSRARKAGLRLDVKEAALASLEGGGRAIVPGDAGKSELLARVDSEDEGIRMPPPKRGDRLAERERTLLRRWIGAGAPWKPHWSLISPVRPAVPQVRDASWPRNEIDFFILSQLEARGIKPSPEAERSQWLRRVTLDLTGLPPTPAEVKAFLSDSTSGAADHVVDRLLDSPQFGERMAQDWLDLARYADSDGHHQDIARSMWQFRDYVISAFNSNKPFDQFTIEQLAGDLLPGATLEQRIATAFNRNNMTTTEAGADAAEYLSKYVIDRVNTTSTVWLGLTLGCAECHDHKFDPVSQKEYYQLYDLFHQVPEKGLDMDPAPPFVKVPSGDQVREADRLASSIRTLAARRQKLLDRSEAESTGITSPADFQGGASASPAVALGEWSTLGPLATRAGDSAYDEEFPPEGSPRPRTAGDTSRYPWKPASELKDGSTQKLPPGPGALYLSRSISRPVGATPARQSFFLGASAGLKLWWNGKLVLARALGRRSVPNQERIDVEVGPGENWLLVKVAAQSTSPETFFFATEEDAGDPELKKAREIASKTPAARSAEENEILRRKRRERNQPELRELVRDLADLEETRRSLEASIPTIRVMEDMPEPRPTHILVRGDYRNLGERVSAGVPKAIAPVPEAPGRMSRLGFARWLVDARNPLVSRVTVNRFWQAFFGTGIVKTSNDFGSQGEPPSHPELLDWLAVEFVSSGWNVKSLLRKIATSSTYRQSSAFRAELIAADPENRLLARGPRLRLSAEMIRDNAIAISGLLDRTAAPGGPSVKPYQPEGLWEEKGYDHYLADRGPNLYRRSLYTYWKRSIPYPSFMAFNAPDREVCVARRETTCTPLQAFVTLNDPTYLEAARVFAQRVLLEPGNDPVERLCSAFKLALARPPGQRELEVLEKLLAEARERYAGDLAAARALTECGDSRPPAELSLPELAAWTILASAILNLDETVTKE